MARIQCSPDDGGVVLPASRPQLGQLATQSLQPLRPGYGLCMPKLQSRLRDPARLCCPDAMETARCRPAPSPGCRLRTALAPPRDPKRRHRQEPGLSATAWRWCPWLPGCIRSCLGLRVQRLGGLVPGAASGNNL